VIPELIKTTVNSEMREAEKERKDFRVRERQRRDRGGESRDF
jgi:hypothetical protein